MKTIGFQPGRNSISPQLMKNITKRYPKRKLPYDQLKLAYKNYMNPKFEPQGGTSDLIDALNRAWIPAFPVSPC